MEGWKGNERKGALYNIGPILPNEDPPLFPGPSTTLAKREKPFFDCAYLMEVHHIASWGTGAWGKNTLLSPWHDLEPL